MSCFGLPMILRTTGPLEVLRVNRPFEERLDLNAKELAQLPLLEWIHPEDRATLERATLERAIEAGEGYALARHRTKLGEWVPLDWRVRAEAHGPAVLGQLQCEGEAWRGPFGGEAPARPTMAETLEGMALIVEAKNPGMRCSILLVDADHQHVTVGAGPSLPTEYNKAVEGLRIGPMVGSCGTAAFWNVPVVVENIFEDPLWRDLRREATIAGVKACWSHPITATNGEVLGAMALYDTEPSTPTKNQMDGLEIAARMVGLAIERDRLETQLHQAAKMEALGVLAGGIAHDFNNMLATVLGHAELALATLPQGSKARLGLHEIVTASISATELCNQMLAYAGRGALSSETLDCNALVRELGGLLRVALSKKATLSYDLPEEPLGVLADRSQLGQVVMNLITNASDAIGENAGRILISMEACTYTLAELESRFPRSGLGPGEYVTLRVSDTGSGMSASTQARIFDPFFTTKTSGRGLGLAAVQGIVLGHKGAITLKSELGAGTTFTVALPRVPLPYEDPPPAHDSGPATSGGHVLVVDDEANVRKVLAQMLEHAGYTVTHARDGLEAIEMFRLEGNSIDCVLLDLSMPKLDGEEVFRELRKLRSDVRVVLISGFAEKEIMDRFKGTGLAGVVQKPAQMHVLLARIARAMSQAHA